MPDVPPSSPPASSKAKIFFRRLLSFVILWTVLLTALFSGKQVISDYVCLVTIAFLAVTGLAEFYGLVEARSLICFKRWGIFAGLLLMVGTFLNLTGKLGTFGTPSRVN